MSLPSTPHLNVRIRQAPVGQGGLCWGKLSSPAHTITWVYDCGSNQNEPLIAEIQTIPRTIDLLFISHLDDDHISGLDTLLTNRNVKEIVLPYLTDEVRVLIAARAVSRGRVTGALVDLLLDPVAWFAERGVQSVVTVGWPDEDGEGPTFELPREPVPPGDGPLRLKWGRPTQSTPKVHGAQKTPADVPLLIAADGPGGGGCIDYVFIPHVHPPKLRLLKAFASELRKCFPLKTLEQIVNAARNEAGRALLRQCYEQIWADHNLISMSLYAGPTGQGSGWNTDLPEEWPHFTWQDKAGWISTGDASFSAEVRRRLFARAFSAVCDQVSVLVAPHHGSALSWHPGVLAPLTNLKVGLAAAGPNGYGHPHSGVRDDFLRTGRDFQQVSEKPSTAFTLRAWTI